VKKTGLKQVVSYDRKVLKVQHLNKQWTWCFRTNGFATTVCVGHTASSLVSTLLQKCNDGYK